MLGRMLGAARLKSATFEDVENDRSATIQALLVVLLVAIATGVGGVLSGDTGLLEGLVFGAIRGAMSWALWALIAMFVGTKILKTQETHGDWGQVARGTGFAQTPGLLNVLIFLPGVGGGITFLIGLWQFAAMVVAVRQSLDYTSTLRAFFVILIAAIPVAIINGIVFRALGI